MGRPHKFRRISAYDLDSQIFNPEGGNEGKIFLSADEIEALRLRHYLDIKQTDAAEKMGISQTTYSRILNSAIGKMTKAIIEGKAIVLQNQENMQLSGHFGRGWRNDPNIQKARTPDIIFKGWGCLECGYQFTSKNEELEKENQKPPCPECKSLATYRLVKKAG
jgi:hypothetical protein